MERADVARMIRGAGCAMTRPASGSLPAEFDCPDTASKVRLLDAAAWAEARYDRRIRRIAVSIAAGAATTHPGDLARAIHAAAKERVAYLGEGIEAFQPSYQTWTSGMGDCDDSSRLIVALARALGMPAGFVVMGDADGRQHICATIGGRWADATLDARFGEHPIAALRRLRAEGAPTRNWSPRGRRGAAPLTRRSRGFLLASGAGSVAAGDLGEPTAAHEATRAALVSAWDTSSGLPPRTAAALQAVQAIARFEGAAGEGCWSRCPGVCFNWGAIQQRGSPIVQGDVQPTNCPDGSAPCTDTHPDGSKYGVCFKTYPDRASGASDYLRTLLVQFETGPVIGSGSADEIATSMIRNHYAGSHGATEAERIDHYADAIAKNAAEVAANFGEPVMVVRGPAASSGEGANAPAVATALAAAAAVALAFAAYKVWRARR